MQTHQIPVATVPLRMPSSAPRAKESSRSSRKRVGSHGPPVVLGGGAGLLGTSKGGASEPHPFASPFIADDASLSPQSPHLPMTFPSPTTTFSFPPPVSAPALPAPSVPIKRGPSPTPPSTSNGSLASSASTSSRTLMLKTPHSKLDYSNTSPMVASSSGSFEGTLSGSPTPGMFRQAVKEAPRSPTLGNRVSEGRRSSVGMLRVAPPIARTPLPPTPGDGVSGRKVSNKTKGAQSRSPGGMEVGSRVEQRLSQDWVQISLPGLSAEAGSPQRNSPSSLDLSPPRPPRSQSRLPPVTTVPIKGSTSPRRPSFERASTAPPLSPSLAPSLDNRARGSLDQLRRTSPTSARGRQSSFSTPPSAVLDSASVHQSMGGRLNLFRSVSRQGSTPPLRTRRSEDMLRPSADTLRPSLESRRPSVDALRNPSKKELKEMQKAAQRDLGMASGNSTPDEKEGGRKSSGLSLKKSSGALKALFNRGGSSKGKDREREVTPPMPSAEDRERGISRSRLSTGESRPPRPSMSSFGRPRTPGSPSPNPASGSPSMGPQPGRSSFSTERAMYPTVPVDQRLPPLSRTIDPVVPQAQGSRQRVLSRELPPLPPPSPLPPSETQGSSGSVASCSPASALTTKVNSSSLPYLGVQASAAVEDERNLPPPLVSGQRSETVSPASSTSTARPAFLPIANEGQAEAEAEISPSSSSLLIKPSKSLHLLSLSELDLSFDVDFDNFGASPSTPRRSPRKSPALSPSVQRSLSTTRITPQSSPSTSLGRSRTERRRSKSFDGTTQSGEDMWRKALASSTSSAPVLSKQLSGSIPPLVPVSSQTDAQPSSSTSSRAEHRRQDSRSFSPQPSAPSSSDHARTPSDASSTNETATPSPPQTPVDRLPRQSFPFPSPGRSTPTRKRSGDDESESQRSKPFSLGEPPNIPLPAAPLLEEPTVIMTPVVLAPAAVIEVPVLAPNKIEPSRPAPPPPREKKLLTKSKVVSPVPGKNLKNLTREIERQLYTFKYPPPQTTSTDRANLVRNELLPLVVELEKRSYDQLDERSNVPLREACFSWAEALLFDLQVEQPANERGACLEGLAGIMESACLSEVALRASPAHQEKFTGVMVRCMTFVMSKLGAKGVFHNTLLFSGRFLAFAFFRVPHIGEQLLTVLHPPKGALMRFTRPILLGASLPAEAQPKYPSHLLPLCFDDSRSYTTRLASLSAEFATEEEHEAFLFQPGNWLRRWQSDDSELFPAFYRAYHRQLARCLTPVIEHFELLGQPVPATVLLRAPGYAHLATIFAKKCHSYILGSVNAVTTSSSSQSFEAQETAGFRGSQKPAVLETANRRLVETITTFANLKVMIPRTTGGVVEVDGTQLWGDMIDIWTKNIISKTSLYAPKGVFSLFDLLDGIVDPPFETVGQRSTESLLDVSYLIYVIRLILTEGEHALTLVKAIAFVFTHWEVLTARPEDRRELCLELLLKKKLFERLLLFWSQSVRSYVLRLVVFRLGHLHTKKEDGPGHEVEIESVRLLQTRLDRIKKRHDELEPRPPSLNEGEEIDENLPLTPIDGSFGDGAGVTRSRSTITMVQDSPQSHMGSANKAERLLGLGFGMDIPKGEVEDSKTGKGSWWKKLGGKQKKRKDAEGTSSPIIDAASASLQPSYKGSSGLRQTPKLSSATLARTMHTPNLPSPASSSSSSEISSPTTETRKPRPPKITTTSPVSLKHETDPAGKSSGNSTSNSNGKLAFEFELPTMSPRSDTFDPSPQPASPRRNSQPPSPRQPQSPHMSRSFSKRSSLLPPPTATALEGIMAHEVGLPQKVSKVVEVEEEGYDKRLHAYAIRTLAELEDAQKEYDEWWSETGVGRMDGAPPRLTVAWPFHEGED